MRADDALSAAVPLERGKLREKCRREQAGVAEPAVRTLRRNDLFGVCRARFEDAAHALFSEQRLVANEKNGLYTSDECYKMALTDAISVACKALGFGADVYWGADRTKYTPQQEPQKPQKPPLICVSCHNAIGGISTSNAKKSAEEVAEFTRRECGADLCYSCYKAWKAEGMA